MNLKQLNDQGQNFWSFVVTALVSLLLTGFVWLSLEVYNSAREHKYRMEMMRTGKEEPKRRIGVRVAILLGLIHGEDLYRKIL